MNTYFKYDKSDLPLGVIISNYSNMIYCNKLFFGEQRSIQKHCVICGVLENIYVWSIQKAEALIVFSGENSCVTRLEYDQRSKLASGYNDGEIRIWSIHDQSFISLKGHTSKVTSLAFDVSSSRLVSGSADTFIILWDLINECGLYKLKGHTNLITKVKYLHNYNVIISSSKDTFIKLWDLDTQHCFATLLGRDSEVWDFEIFDDESQLISATSSDELKIWKFEKIDVSDDKKRFINLNTLSDIPLKCTSLSSILKKIKSRTKALKLDSTCCLLICLNKNSSLEFYNSSHQTANNRISKEYFSFLGSCFESDVNEIDIVHYDDNNNTVSVCLGFKNNLIGIYCYKFSSSEIIKRELFLLSSVGHRTPPTSVAINSSGTFFATCSNEEIKMWSLDKRRCIRSFEANLCTCLIFTSGDRYILCGFNSGVLSLFDTTNGELIYEIEGHTKKIWDIEYDSNDEEFITASSDCYVKFWTIRDKIICSSRDLEMDEDCLSVALSKNSKFLAVSLIDSNVKIFFKDTLKYFVTLYGHKLPVNSIDISSDNELILTGSGDKNIKIWGLRFGDCRKSIFAHEGCINEVRFLKDEHHFWSCSNDNTIKFWDGDKFELVFTLKGHFDKVSKMSLAHDGELLISVSHDNSIRIWKCDDSELVIRENEFEKIDINVPLLKCPIKEGENEVLVAWNSSAASIQTCDDLIDAINLMEEVEQKPENDRRHPILDTLKLSSQQYVLFNLNQIRSTEIEVTLMTLPFKYVMKLLNLITHWLSNSMSVELCCRCSVFLIKLHFYQILNTPSMKDIVTQLSILCKERINSLKETVGLNLACMNHMKNHIQNTSNVNIYNGLGSKTKKNSNR